MDLTDEPAEVEVLAPTKPPAELSEPADAPEPARSEDALATTGDGEPLQLVRPETDMSAFLTESQRRRLAPVNSLRRKRRSRKLRVVGADAGNKYVPIVPGARATQDESIMNAFSGETLSAKREQGEDYWVDPTLLKSEIEQKEERERRRASFKLKGKTFDETKLRQEMVAPYKNNVIGTIVVGVGVVAVIFALFPSLLENDVATSIASFPETL